jgi:amino acid transporter
MKSDTGVFARKASGLVRTASTLDVFIYDAALISVGMGLALIVFWGPAFYSGGSMTIASILTIIGFLPVVLTYYFWSITFPRSGGDYVFLSRGLHPAIGYALSFTEFIAMLFFVTLFAATLVTVGFTSLFSTLGTIAGSPALSDLGVWFGQPLGIFVGGLIVTLYSVGLLISGMRRYFTVQKVAFAIAIIGTVALLYSLMTATRADFKSGLDHFMGTSGSYDTIIEAAKQQGWTNPGFSWDETIKLIVWPAIPLAGAFFSIVIGGEIKKPEKAQIIGMLGSLLFTGIIFAVLPPLAENVFGYDFLGAVAYLFIVAPASSTPMWPYVPLLLSITSGQNLAVIVLVIVGFLAWMYLLVPAELLYASRMLIGFAFDRVVPLKFAHVSDRFHTPTVAIGLSGLGVLIWLCVWAFTTVLSTITLETPLIVVWAIAVVTAIFFPFTNRALYEKSPASHFSVGKVPLMTIMGALGGAFMFFLLYLMLLDPVAAGPLQIQVITILVPFIVGLAIFYGVRAYRRRQGIEIDFAFKEIPLE